MNYKATGSITLTEGAHLLEALQRKDSDIKGRPRLHGFDISLKNEEAEVYINSYDDVEFNLDIATTDFDVLKKYMDIVKNSCEELECQYDITYSNSEEDFMKDTIYAKSE